MTYSPGSESPLGATLSADGVNFSIFCTAENLSLLLFYDGKKKPFQTITLDPLLHKTDSNIWHVFISNLQPPFEYMYKVTNSEGTFIVHDPYAKVLNTPDTWNSEVAYRPKAVLPIPSPFDWENVKKPETPYKDWIIYEMHVRGFTRQPHSKVQGKGTFLGLIEKIPHLLSLGVNAIELLPIFEFSERENKRRNSKGKRLVNFWGYSTVNFFCPMRRYATAFPVHEFKTLVKELHKNKIAIILDVVYNHSAEQGHLGRTFSFKALSKKSYYHLDQEGNFKNYSGTGNTFNCNNPATTKLIVDSLSYWAEEMQVDGFRFDLASVLTRGESGDVVKNPPVLKAIKKAPALKNSVLIAEAWDAAGLYQIGEFPSEWSEWNGRYRDNVREFIKGTSGKAGDFARALCGSSEIYSKDKPTKSINFITAHDGYSLCDLVSYQDKHNKENGEQNKDGSNDNASWNCGHEGKTRDPEILALRERQMKNFLLALFVSLGIPMFLMGDEYAHTRKGNNNPYCQDNDLNWFLWDKLEENQTFFQFVRNLIALRKEKKDFFCRDTFLSDKDVFWHGKTPSNPDWSAQSRFVAYTLKDPHNKSDLFIAFNANYDPISFTLPEGNWIRKIDTSLKSPQDFIENGQEGSLLEKTYQLSPYSSFVAEQKN